MTDNPNKKFKVSMENPLTDVRQAIRVVAHELMSFVPEVLIEKSVAAINKIKAVCAKSKNPLRMATLAGEFLDILYAGGTRPGYAYAPAPAPAQTRPAQKPKGFTI